MCKSHHVTTDKGVDGRTHHNPDDFASPIVKVAFVEKLLAPRLLGQEPDEARWTDRPDAEGRVSGGMRGPTGAIPLPRPDQNLLSKK